MTPQAENLSSHSRVDPARTWVVGVDGSEHSEQALRWAALHAKRRGVSVEAVGAWHYPYYGMPPAAPGIAMSIGTSVQEAMSDGVSQISATVSCETGTPIEARALMGSAAHVLLERVEHAELAVVGSRGLGGFAGLMLGSVSHQVALHSPKPTVIVPGPTTSSDLSRIVVGVGGSKNSMEALRWALKFADPETELTAVGCWNLAAADLAFPDSGVLDSVFEFEERRLKMAVDTVEAECATRGRFERAFEVGSAGLHLAEQAKHADLLVVGERSHSGVGGALYGSTTTWLIHHLHCPTVVVPVPGPAVGD